MRVFSSGRSAILVMRPNCPAASPSLSVAPCRSASTVPFQKPKAQWLLKAAMLASMPLYKKWGALHFIASSTSGQPACTTLRRCRRIGWAKSAALAMYSSTRGSFFPIGVPLRESGERSLAGPPPYPSSLEIVGADLCVRPTPRAHTQVRPYRTPGGGPDYEEGGDKPRPYEYATAVAPERASAMRAPGIRACASAPRCLDPCRGRPGRL